MPGLETNTIYQSLTGVGFVWTNLQCKSKHFLWVLAVNLCKVKLDVWTAIYKPQPANHTTTPITLKLNGLTQKIDA